MDNGKTRAKPARHWLMYGFLEKECRAFESVAARFAGDLPPAAAFLLNWWIKTPDGTGWLLREASVEEKELGNCTEVFNMSFHNVRRGVVKRANVDYDGIIEIALRQTIRDALQTLGLSELYKNG